MVRIIVFCLLCILASCSQYDCNKYQGKSTKEIEVILSYTPVGPLSHELFILGECKINAGIPILEQYLYDPRVSHHALHKGMSLSYITEGSIKKISEGNE